MNKSVKERERDLIIDFIKCNTCIFFFFLIKFRFVGEYSNFPADYAEVSTFRKTPSECDSSGGSHSPAPYATTTLVGSSRLTNFRHNSHHNMYFSNDLYPQTGNRSVYSESYFNPNAKINITENKLSNAGSALVGTCTSASGGIGSGGGFGINTSTVGNNSTYKASISVPHTPLGTIRRNRLKLSRIPQFRISFGDGAAENSNMNQQQQQQKLYDDQQEQLYVKVGETNPPSSDVYMNWGHQHQQEHYNNNNKHQQQQQEDEHYEQHQNRSIYQQNHRQDIDNEMIYAPSGNRSIISYMSSNNRLDDV